MLEGRNAYYQERAQFGDRATEYLGGVLSGLMIGLGVNLSHRYREHISHKLREVVAQGGTLDAGDRIVMRALPAKYRSYVHAGRMSSR